MLKQFLEDVLLQYRSVHCRSLNQFNRSSPDQPEGFDLQGLPFRFHLDDLVTDFIRFSIVFDITHISQEDRQ